METASWTDYLERHFGQWAVPNLVRGIVVLNILIYILMLGSPEFLSSLILTGSHLMNGEVWRLFTFFLILDPSLNTHWLFLLITLWVMWFIGEYLEEEWGAFKVNLFYLVGVLSVGIFSLFFPMIVIPSWYLNAMPFLAFATLFPTFVFHLYFLIPIEAKWLGVITGGLILLSFITVENASERMLIFASAINYLSFFGPTAVSTWKQRYESKQRLKELRRGYDEFDNEDDEDQRR